MVKLPVSNTYELRKQSKTVNWDWVGDTEVVSESRKMPENSIRSPYKAKPVRLVPKETKSSLLRLESRSRSPSPQPVTKSREPSPSPASVGKRKDYTKGKVHIIYLHPSKDIQKISGFLGDFFLDIFFPFVSI